MTDYPLFVLNEPCDCAIPIRGRALDYELSAVLVRFRILHRPEALDASDWEWVGGLVRGMADAGLWLLLKSPFIPGDPWWAGFTPHGASGWNGTPDYYASAPTGPAAIARAAVLWQQEEGEK